MNTPEKPSFHLKDYFPAFCGGVLALFSLVFLLLYSDTVTRDDEYYEFAFLGGVYLIGISLIWVNVYVFSKKNAHFIFIGLLVFGPIVFSNFNSITPACDSLVISFKPGFEGRFVIIGGVKNHPPLRKLGKTLYAQIPDSGVLYTSSYYSIRDDRQEDSSIYSFAHYAYGTSECSNRHSINYSGYYIDKKKLRIDTVYDDFFKRDDFIYNYDGIAHKGESSLNWYLQKKYDRFDDFMISATRDL